MTLLYIHSMTLDLCQVSAGWQTTVKLMVIGSYDCGNLNENNSKYKHVVQTCHCAAWSLCWQHSILCCSACNLELPSKTSFKVTTSVQQGFLLSTHTLHQAIYCTCEQVKATFQSDENDPLVSSSSQTANEMDSPKESFGPPCCPPHSNSVLM